MTPTSPEKSPAELSWLSYALMLAIIAWFLVATVQRNNVWANGLSLWEDTAEKSPNKVRPLLNAGTQAVQIKDYAKATDYFNRAMKAGGNTRIENVYRGHAKTNLAIIAIEQGQYEQAARMIVDVLATSPNLEAFNAYAFLALHQGHPDVALNTTTQILQLNPDWRTRPSLWETRGLALKALGRCSEAQDSFRVTAYLVPNYQIPTC